MDVVERSYGKKRESRNSTAAALFAPLYSFLPGGLWYKKRHAGAARAGGVGAKNTNGAT